MLAERFQVVNHFHPGIPWPKTLINSFTKLLHGVWTRNGLFFGFQLCKRDYWLFRGFQCEQTLHNMVPFIGAVADDAQTMLYVCQSFSILPLPDLHYLQSISNVKNSDV